MPANPNGNCTNHVRATAVRARHMCVHQTTLRVIPLAFQCVSSEVKSILRIRKIFWSSKLLCMLIEFMQCFAFTSLKRKIVGERSCILKKRRYVVFYEQFIHFTDIFIYYLSNHSPRDYVIIINSPVTKASEINSVYDICAHYNFMFI